MRKHLHFNTYQNFEEEQKCKKNEEVLVRSWRNFSESRNFSRDVTNEMGMQ